MIEINLLPDIKQEYVRAQRARRMTVSIAVLVGVVCAGILVASIVIYGGQRSLEALSDRSINDNTAKLAEQTDAAELVTLQNQLATLPQQHASKSADSRLFTVLQAINPQAPNSVAFNTVALDPESKVLSLEGTAEGGYPAVEALKKTIERTKFEYREAGEDSATTEPLASVVEVGETGYGLSSDNKRVVSFVIRIQYAEKLFSNAAENARVIAQREKIDVTDSRIGVPDSLFAAPATSESEEE